MTNHCFPKGVLIEKLDLMEAIFSGIFDVLDAVASEDLDSVFRPFF